MTPVYSAHDETSHQHSMLEKLLDTVLIMKYERRIELPETNVGRR